MPARLFAIRAVPAIGLAISRIESASDGLVVDSGHIGTIRFTVCKPQHGEATAGVILSHVFAGFRQVVRDQGAAALSLLLAIAPHALFAWSNGVT